MASTSAAIFLTLFVSSSTDSRPFSCILVGLAVGTGVWIAMNQSVKTSNAGIDSEKQRLQDAANNEIRQEYMRADQRTQQEITAYERDVKMYAQKLWQSRKASPPW